MMIDQFLTLCGSILGNTITPLSMSGNGTTVLSTNTIDLGVAKDFGEGDPLYARVQVNTTAFTGGTSAEFQVIQADAANLTGNVTVVGTTGAIPVASLVLGARFAARINPRLMNQGQRYLGLQCVNVGNNTAGSVFADIGKEIQDHKNYANGFAVL